MPLYIDQLSRVINLSSPPKRIISVVPSQTELLNFLGLKEELAGTGLSVSVIYPGPIMTNSHTSRRIISQGLKGKMGLLSTPDIAHIALKGTMAGHPVIIPGLMNKINHVLMQLLPLSFRMRIVSREVKKEIPYSLSV